MYEWLTDEQVRAIFLSSKSRKELAREYGIDPAYVGAIRSRKSRANATKDLTREG